jgi:hypothetical protein
VFGRPVAHPRNSSTTVRASTALVLLLLAGCGSDRLETAILPDTYNSTMAGTASSGGAGTGGSVSGAGGAPSPVQTQELVEFDDFGGTFLHGPVTGERFQVFGQTFVQAWRATMLEAPSTPWVAQLVVPVYKPIQAGQLLHVSFWLSCETPGETGDCYTECIFERSEDPWEKSVTFVAHGSDVWTEKSEYFASVDPYEAGLSHLVFRLGYAQQVIAIGGIELEAIGP